MAGLIGGCTTTPEQPSYWPGDDWRTSTPEEQGLDSALTSNPQARGQLEAEIKKIERPEEKPASPLPEIATQI
jgi:hypothetical protein